MDEDQDPLKSDKDDESVKKACPDYSHYSKFQLQ